ncbi:MAG TPA: hypothetical protein EYN66_11670 [Myxococcales bacterium]|nr:hypothetical protein [Myxococcales bacterium]
MNLVPAFALLPLWLFACSDPATKNGKTQLDDSGENTLFEGERSFSMGMTDWPYDATWEAVERTQQLVADHGDLYAVWMDNGLPWAAAVGGGPYPAEVNVKLTELGIEFPAGSQRFVSVGLLDQSRTELTTDWAGAVRSGEFADISWADQRVEEAYANWLDEIIAKLEPNWLNFAIEFSDLALNAPDRWQDASATLCTVYNGLKSRHPDLPVFFSVALKHPAYEDYSMLTNALPDVEDCTDYAAASSYGYVFYGHPDAGNPDNLPDNWLSQIEELIPSKPVVVAETAWIAEDLLIHEWDVSVASNAQYQSRYVEMMLEEAQRMDAELVTWWCVVDFDALWEGLLGADPLASIWRDTGFYDEHLTPRPSLDIWEEWRNREKY